MTTARALCGVCNGDPARRKFVDFQLASGTPPAKIERMAKDAGHPVKRETITKHRDGCLGVTSIGTPRPPEETQLAARAAATGSNGDMAELVKAEAIRLLEEGKLKVTTQDGLAAQALIDRRQEKQKDRELAAAIGRLLAGGGTNGASPPPIIEGDYTEVEPGGELIQIGSGE